MNEETSHLSWKEKYEHQRQVEYIREFLRQEPAYKQAMDEEKEASDWVFKGKAPSQADRSKNNDIGADNKQGKYCQIVTAPPGKLGITFLENSSQCVVSEISSDSPLAGKVFPSDILLAIDDVPVVATPIRTAMGILQSRSRKSRELTLLSSNTMPTDQDDSNSQSSIKETQVYGPA